MAIIGGNGGYIPLSDRGGVMQDRVVTGVTNAVLKTILFTDPVTKIRITTTVYASDAARVVFDALSDAMATAWLDFTPSTDDEVVEWRQLAPVVNGTFEAYFPKGLDRLDFRGTTAASHSFRVEAE